MTRAYYLRLRNNKVATMAGRLDMSYKYLTLDYKIQNNFI